MARLPEERFTLVTDDFYDICVNTDGPAGTGRVRLRWRTRRRNVRGYAKLVEYARLPPSVDRLRFQEWP